MSVKAIIKATPMVGVIACIFTLAGFIVLLSAQRIEPQEARSHEEFEPAKEAKRKGCLRKDGIWICHTP